ncbi:RNA methyltransferase TrmH, group 1 [Calothrix sp. NIES-4071]|nr:RNA methyltransferase TrmH, group 1 [Calothrix sp. NIES-4071]BAZ56736.1 RNA methyltransferase TrmH, group 1 [Calothrix sp. NIES-4105]
MIITGIKIILVEPAGPLNVGSIARVMKNFGFTQLVLVNPQCDYLGAEAKLMAVRASDILESAMVVDSLPEALVGCKRSIATTGVEHDWNPPLETPRTCLPWLLEQTAQPSALIFGREDRGLSKEELNYAQRFVRIPSGEEYSSLNLAMAVGICCYELAQQADVSLPSTDVTKNIKTANQLAPVELVESYYQQLELLLLRIGYLFPHTASSRMEKFRQLYNRTQLQNRELAMLRGILHQVEWALDRKIKPDDL